MTITSEQKDLIDQLFLTASKIKDSEEHGIFIEEDIEELRELCDKIHSPWRSVRLAPKSGVYIVINASAEVHTSLFNGIDDWCGYGRGPITHYMPMPEISPKEADDVQ